MTLHDVTDRLLGDLEPLRFGPPVSHVYNPLQYARKAWDQYLHAYGAAPREAILLGMNPGPFGMVQTGVPFGDVVMAREWLSIEGPVERPAGEHPKRPILGFDCPRREVSGTRIWSWARDRFETPERFFARFFVANYCPLAFLEESGRNRTPDKLPVGERRPLLAACDQALVQTVETLGARIVVGIGRFAESRAREALAGTDVEIANLLHPSPANPRANKGWAQEAERQLGALGLLD